MDKESLDTVSGNKYFTLALRLLFFRYYNYPEIISYMP